MKKFKQFVGKVIDSIVQNDDGKNSYFIIKFTDGSKMNIVGYLSDDEDKKVNLVGKPYESAAPKTYIEESLDDHVNKSVKLDEGFININIVVNTDDNSLTTTVNVPPAQPAQPAQPTPPASTGVIPVEIEDDDLDDDFERFEDEEEELDYEEGEEPEEGEEDYDPDTDYDEDEEEFIEDEVDVVSPEGEDGEEGDEEDYDPDTDYDEDEDISEEGEPSYLKAMHDMHDPHQHESEDYLQDYADKFGKDYDPDTDFEEEGEDYDPDTDYDEDDDFDEDEDFDEIDVENAEIPEDDDEEEAVSADDMETVLHNQLSNMEFNRADFRFTDPKTEKEYTGIVLAKLSAGYYLFKTDEGVKKIHVDNVHEEI